MKKLLVLSLILGITLPLSAFENPIPEHGRLSISGIINTANKERISLNNGFDVTGKSVLGANFNYELPISDVTSYGVGIAYLTGEKDRFQGNTTDYDYRLFLVTAKGNYHINQNIYLSAAMNFSLPTIDKANIDYSGRLGYEIGAGYIFNENFSAELSYLQINMDVESAGKKGTSLYDTIKGGISYHFYL
tara:strand:+ start:405 stop:974 length:570 start_codon:yes stop_codon:yes gene_type:complete